MIYIILLGYILPLIITALIHYFDEATETVGDFFNAWVAIFIPVFNIIFVVWTLNRVLWEKINVEEYFEKLSNKKLWK